MAQPTLTAQTLNCLVASRDIALDNVRFYERLYDDLEDTVERDNIGRAMAQKHSFIGAVEAILTNHDMAVDKVSITPTRESRDGVLECIDSGEHLLHEERFYASLESCVEGVEDDLTTELLNHHMKAAELAVSAIKASSLNI